MKRLIATIFSLCFIFTFTSCRHTDVPQDTTETTDTTETIDTTETTTAPQNTAWKPDPSTWWLYTPAHKKDGHVDDWIILTLTESEFAEAPEELEVTIRNNRTPEYPDEPMFIMSLHAYYEKVYPSSEIGYGIEMGFPYSMWVRLPIAFGRSGYLSGIPLTNPEFTFSFPFASAVQDESLELTPGSYRLVLYAADGPHYAYFRITG